MSCSEFGSGHINLTCKVKTDSGKSYILQRINQYVFTDPKAVMENVGAVTEYLRTRVSNQRDPAFYSFRFRHILLCRRDR